MAYNEAEIDFMAVAVGLATRGCGHTRPNPPVGAVVVKDGMIIGRGWHRKCGGDHAEVAAMRDAVRQLRVKGEKPKVKSGSGDEGDSGRGDALSLSNCELYVTLEPCSKPGRVGACTDAIIAAGINKVVWAVSDPNPKNRGKAKRVLRAAGIACECWETDRRYGDDNSWHRYMVASSARILAPFAKHVTTGLPYVSVKIAMSLDGKICDDWGDAKWISSAHARRATGCFRSVVDVMMVGAETVRKDDPSLLCHMRRNDDLWRVIVSKSGKLPKLAQVFTDEAKDRTLVYRDAVEAVRDLGNRGFMHILCEGGLKLATSLAEAGLVDEWITVLAPKVIGTRRIGEAVKFKKLNVGYGGDGDNEFIGYFGREAPGALY